MVSALSQAEADLLKKYPDSKQDIAHYRDILQTIAAREGANDFVNGFRLGAMFVLDIIKTTD